MKRLLTTLLLFTGLASFGATTPSLLPATTNQINAGLSKNTAVTPYGLAHSTRGGSSSSGIGVAGWNFLTNANGTVFLTNSFASYRFETNGTLTALGFSGPIIFGDTNHALLARSDNDVWHLWWSNNVSLFATDAGLWAPNLTADDFFGTHFTGGTFYGTFVGYGSGIFDLVPTNRVISITGGTINGGSSATLGSNINIVVTAGGGNLSAPVLLNTNGVPFLTTTNWTDFFGYVHWLDLRNPTSGVPYISFVTLSGNSLIQFRDLRGQMSRLELLDQILWTRTNELADMNYSRVSGLLTVPGGVSTPSLAAGSFNGQNSTNLLAQSGSFGAWYPASNATNFVLNATNATQILKVNLTNRFAFSNIINMTTAPIEAMIPFEAAPTNWLFLMPTNLAWHVVGPNYTSVTNGSYQMLMASNTYWAMFVLAYPPNNIWWSLTPAF